MRHYYPPAHSFRVLRGDAFAPRAYTGPTPTAFRIESSIRCMRAAAGADASS